MTYGNYVSAEAEVIGGVTINFHASSLSLLPTRDLAPWHELAAAMDPFLEGYLSNPMNFSKGHKDYFRSIQGALRSSASVDGVAEVLNGMLNEAVASFDNDAEKWDGKAVRLRKGVRFFVTQARNAGLVLYPIGIMRHTLVPWIDRSAQLQASNLHADLAAFVANQNEGRVGKDDHKLLVSLFSKFNYYADYRTVADFTEDFFARFWATFHDELKDSFQSAKAESTLFTRTKGLLNRIFETLVTYQRLQDPNYKAPKHASSVFRRMAENEQSLSHHSFAWLTKERPDLVKWSEAFSWFVNCKPLKQPEALVGSFKPFLEYLKSLKAPPLEPAKFTRNYVVKRENALIERTYLQFLDDEGYAGRQIGYNALNDVKRFFEIWHDEHGQDMPDWKVPIKEHDINTDWLSPRGKSNKEVLPVRIIKVMKQIITEKDPKTGEDYAWPKSLPEDYFSRFDAEKGIFVDTWSPSRAIGLLLMLILPIRTIQMRLLDSGEADELVYDRSTDEWLKNTSALAQPGRQEGILKQIYDTGTRQNYVGFHITTNKTASIKSANFEVGYDIPWECDELAPHIDFLLNWQKSNNPVTRLITRRDVADKGLHPNAAVTKLPGYTFLFRDAANKDANRADPVTHGRMRGFFLKLLAEVERRLQADGENVQLVTRNNHNNLQSSYTLHGLRTSGITHYVKAGVPLQVIAEFLSGHATILMTLHYSKFGPKYITDILDEAQRAIEEGWEDEFIEMLEKTPSDQLAGVAAYNDQAGLDWLADTSPGLWSVGIDGICPTGRAMCDVGGEQLSTHNNPYYAPVPGGARNCARCRFFITGPAFLNGQVIAFNTTVFAMNEKVKDLQRLKQRVAQAEASGKLGRKIERERNHVDAMETELSEMTASLQARCALIERSRALLHEVKQVKNAEAAGESRSTEKHQLITRMSGEDDVNIVLEATHEFDLVDFVAQACELFPEKAEPAARLRKGKILDQFLKKNGYQALFYALPDDEALEAGNRLTRFLQEKVGRDRVRSLMNGGDTLEALGIAKDFETMAGPLLSLNILDNKTMLEIEAQ